ncbi:hypothetical protein BGZ60DRAFT_565592 [Tricladium varicosporioides]|nr:hypothetical protein BGZ60DRAFT_565592 [Hymenoscyphus varicosporioides]
MPTAKGIKVTLVSHTDFAVFPEFPHQESSQFINLSSLDLDESPAVTYAEYLIEVRDGDRLSRAPSGRSESKADRLLGKSTAVCVYIPSVPSSRFYIRCQILEEAAMEDGYYYFEMRMNGYDTINWGCSAREGANSEVMRALFDPTPEHNYVDESGVGFKNCGLERCAFFFAHPRDDAHIKDDGGMIEIQVYRAHHKYRKVQEPLEYRDQSNYGVNIVSGGLLDDPEEADFYDWTLKDAKDKPYTTIKYYYRSWSNLAAMDIISTDLPKKLLAPSPSLLALRGLSLKYQEELDERNFEVYPSDIESVDIADLAENSLQGRVLSVRNATEDPFSDNSPPNPKLSEEKIKDIALSEPEGSIHQMSAITRACKPAPTNLSPPADHNLAITKPLLPSLGDLAALAVMLTPEREREIFFSNEFAHLSPTSRTNAVLGKMEEVAAAKQATCQQHHTFASPSLAIPEEMDITVAYCDSEDEVFGFSSGSITARVRSPSFTGAVPNFSRPLSLSVVPTSTSLLAAPNTADSPGKNSIASSVSTGEIAL